MRYIVHNIIGDGGAQSVGTFYSDPKDVAYTVAQRAGYASSKDVIETILQLRPGLVPSVTIPAAEGSFNSNAVKVEISEEPRAGERLEAAADALAFRLGIDPEKMLTGSGKYVWLTVEQAERLLALMEQS